MRTSVALVCVWGVVTTLASIPQPDSPLAEDCVLYDGQSTGQPKIPHKTFSHRVSFGITPQDDGSAWHLELHSPTNNASCKLLFLDSTVVPTCEEKHQFTWPGGIMQKGMTTEFWIQIGDTADTQTDPLSSSSSSSTRPSPSRLLLVAKKAGQRGHLHIPSSGLLSPVTVQIIETNRLQYFFNCVTGCLYGKSAQTQPGDFNFYLRPGPGFLYLTLTYDVGDTSLNVTANDLGPTEDGEVKKVTVVSASDGTKLGAFVDGKRVGELGQRGNLKREVKAEVAGEGLVASCELIFQVVAGGGNDLGERDQQGETGDEQVTGSTDNSTMPSQDALCSSANTSVILGILLPITLILLVTTIFFAILLCKSSGKLKIFNESSSSTRNSSRQVSLKNSKRHGSLKDSMRQGSLKDSKHQGSIKDSKRQGSFRDSKRKGDDADCGSSSEVTAALSDTTMTPANTPGSLGVPRSPNMVSSKEFVTLDLMS